MALKNKLTVADKFYIDGNADKSAKDLAKDIGCLKKVVEKYLNSKPKVVPEESLPTDPTNEELKKVFLSPPEPTKSDVVPCRDPNAEPSAAAQQYGRRSGSVTCTEGASLRGNPPF